VYAAIFKGCIVTSLWPVLFVTCSSFTLTDGLIQIFYIDIKLYSDTVAWQQEG